MGQGQDCNTGLHSPIHLSLPHDTFASLRDPTTVMTVVVIMITIPSNKCLLTYLLTAMTIPTVAPRATNTQGDATQTQALLVPCGPQSPAELSALDGAGFEK